MTGPKRAVRPPAAVYPLAYDHLRELYVRVDELFPKKAEADGVRYSLTAAACAMVAVQRGRFPTREELDALLIPLPGERL